MIALARRERKSRTRHAILGSAAALFARKGFLATTTADVAEAAGVSHGSVFAHFATRDELVERVVTEFGGRIAAQVKRVREGGGVRAVLSAHLDGLMDHEAFYTRLVQEGRFLPRDARRMLVEIQSAISTQLAAALEEGASRGTIRRIPVDFAFNLWIGVLNHYVMNRDLFAPRGRALKTWGPKLLNRFMNLLEERA